MQENKQEKSPIKERITQYLELKGVTKYSFYKDSGVSRNILDQNTGISEDNISRFLAYAPEISVKWLITGKGEMFKTEEETNITKNTGEPKVQKNFTNEFPKIAAERYQGYTKIKSGIKNIQSDNAPVEKVPQIAENIFTGDTDKEIEDFIADAFSQHLLEMYETGRAYPAVVVKSMLEEKNSRIRELEREIKELDRKLYHDSSDGEVKKDLF